MKATISGAAFAAAMHRPGAGAMLAELGVGRPRVRDTGYGRQMIYDDIGHGQATAIAAHLRSTAERLLLDADPVTTHDRNVHTALLRDADRIVRRVAAEQLPPVDVALPVPAGRRT